jgi:hypothetical protein
MSLQTTYKEYILEKLLLEYLKDGVVPTTEQLENDLEAYQETHPDLSLPKSKFIDFSVTRGGHSSASHIETIVDTVSGDVGAIVREIYNLTDKGSKFYERWSFESKRLAAKAQKLERQVNNLLLLANYTTGYFSAVSDLFTDMNLVNTDNTTAYVNVDEQAVTLNPGTSESSAIKQINTNDLTDLDVSFYSLSKRAGTAVFDVSSNNNLVQAFKTSDTIWVGKVTSSISGEITCELRANISKDKDVEVSRIAFDYTGPVSERATVTAMYSKDGYAWYIVPTNEATKPLIPNTSWIFPLTEMRWVKFIFYKAASDSGQYEYDFSLRHIRFYGITYYADGGNLFESSSLSATDVKGNLVGFNLAQLDVCENIPEGTDIKYYLSVSKNNSSWTSWTDVLPSEREEIKYPKVLSFAGAGWKNNTTDDYRLSSSYDNDVLITVFDSTAYDTSRGILQYRFKDTSFAAVNTAILVSLEEDQDAVANSIVLWRNIRNKVDYPDTNLVRGVSRGWGKHEQTYSCYFEILSSDGRLLDFGGRECVLDGQRVTGVIKVPVGIHKFETDSENWFDIAENYINLVGTSGTIESEETLESIDPLYPYNHKLIVDGFPYPSQFSGNQVYSGTDYSAEFYASKTSLFDLENNINGFGHFAVRGINKDDEAPTLCSIVRYDPSDSDYTNELFIVRWRAGQSGSEMYKYIKLKAELISDNAAQTPALTSYRIKLGL